MQSLSDLWGPDAEEEAPRHRSRGEVDLELDRVLLRARTLADSRA